MTKMNKTMTSASRWMKTRKKMKNTNPTLMTVQSGMESS